MEFFTLSLSLSSAIRACNQSALFLSTSIVRIIILRSLSLIGREQKKREKNISARELKRAAAALTLRTDMTENGELLVLRDSNNVYLYTNNGSQFLRDAGELGDLEITADGERLPVVDGYHSTLNDYSLFQRDNGGQTGTITDDHQWLILTKNNTGAFDLGEFIPRETIDYDLPTRMPSVNISNDRMLLPFMVTGANTCAYRHNLADRNGETRVHVNSECEGFPISGCMSFRNSTDQGLKTHFLGSSCDSCEECALDFAYRISGRGDLFSADNYLKFHDLKECKMGYFPSQLTGPFGKYRI